VDIELASITVKPYNEQRRAVKQTGLLAHYSALARGADETVDMFENLNDKLA